MKHTKIKKHFLSISLALLLVGCASTPTQESTGQYLDNSGITAQIKSAYLADSEIKSFPITVNTYKGVVQLSGFVDTHAEAQRAAAIARNVRGVVSVKNNLQVKNR